MVADAIAGAASQGWMMYDASGHMCMHFNDSTRPLWASATEPTEAELRTLYSHTVAYCARYRVDAARAVRIYRTYGAGAVQS